MHVSVGGRPATAELSTDVWQYLQSIPSSPTWCLWLNGTGWAGATDTSVMNEPALILYAAHTTPLSMITAVTMLTFAKLLELR